MINYLEHHIVDHCNLRCAGCSHFSSIAPQWYEKLLDFQNDFTELSKKSNQQIRIIRLMGGEPLLHPNVSSFLIIARKLFPQSEIQLVTNGILLKDEEIKNNLIKICNFYKIVICISNYGLNFDLNELLSGFDYKIIHEKSDLYNISLTPEQQQDPQEMFNHCDLHIHHWYYFQNGCFYPCCVSANIKHFNQHFNQNLPEDSCAISIYDNSIEEIEKFLNQPIPLCRYCDTIQRQKSYHQFSVSKGEISEWTYQ